MKSKNEKIRIYSLVSIACYLVISLIIIFLGITDRISKIASSVVWIAILYLVFYKKKIFLSYALIAGSFTILIRQYYIINLPMVICMILKIASFITAGLVVILSQKKKDKVAKLVFIPSTLYLAFFIYNYHNIFSSGFYIELVLFVLSDLLLIPAFLFVDLWAVNYVETIERNPVGVPIQNKVSDADRLLKLKELLDSGAITQQEFEEKKKQILNL